MAFEDAVLGGILAGMAAGVIVVALALWVYMSLAYMYIAKRNKQKNYALAWIPYIGPLIISFNASKMDWWPWLLLSGLFVPVIGGVALLVFTVFAVIWHWRMFEEIKRPGWWALLLLIPIVNFVMIGIAAWGKN